MITSQRLPSTETIKLHAKRLRQSLLETGCVVSHSQSLELVAKQWGFSDWNTLIGLVKSQCSPASLSVGDRISGKYLGENFDGTVIGLKPLGDNDVFNITLLFDTPIYKVEEADVCTLKNGVTRTIGQHGHTVEKLPCGSPQLILNL